MSIGTDEATVELDTARIVAAVADALLWSGALPPDSAVLSERPASLGWQEELAELWGRQAWRRARDGEPAWAGLAVGLPLRRATAVIESIAAHDDLVSIAAVRASVGDRRVLADDRAEFPGAGDR